MPFEPGHNIGRAKGTENKITSDIKKLMAKIIQDELDGLPNLFAELKPYQRCDIILKMCKFIIPPAPPEMPESPRHAETISNFINALRADNPPQEKKSEKLPKATVESEPQESAPCPPVKPKPKPEPPKQQARLERMTANTEVFKW